MGSSRGATMPATSPVHRAQLSRWTQPGFAKRSVLGLPRCSTTKQESASPKPVSATDAAPAPSLDTQILSLAVPALGVEVIDPLLSVADAAFVGRLGAAELGGLGVASAVFTSCNSLFNFLSNATGPLVAQALARDDLTVAKKTTGQALVLAASLGFSCCTVLHLFGLPILEAISGGSKENAGPVLDAAIAYLSIRSWGLPAGLICRVNGGAFRGLLDTKTPFYVALGANAVNVVLNPFLIFGIGPFPHLGIEGAALTTVAAEWLAAFAGLYSLSRSRLGIPDVSIPEWSELQPLLQASLALFIRTASLQSVFLLASSTVSHTALLPDGTLDPTQVAAHQITFQCWMFLSFFVDSVAVAAQGLVGDSLGKGDVKKAIKAGDRTLQYGAVLGVVLGISFAFGKQWLPFVFSEDQGVISTARGVLGIVAFAQPISGLVFVFDGIFMGAADFEFVASSVLTACLLGEGLMVLRGGGLVGVWQSLVLVQVARAVGLGLRYWGYLGGPFVREKESG
ncbi:hypothetical protein BSKO_00764 [Bryopsis sp. KO-2023]|nr:hypothetical protein BSKO_00764 [Bryopsis sp. KO-2023]